MLVCEVCFVLCLAVRPCAPALPCFLLVAQADACAFPTQRLFAGVELAPDRWDFPLARRAALRRAACAEMATCVDVTKGRVCVSM